MKIGIKFLTAAFAVAVATSAMAQQITVVVNGGNVDFAGQPPVMSGDRVLVPLRGVLEKMGAHVMWDPSTQTVRAFRDKTNVQLTIGQNTASVNGQPVNLDVPAQILNGSTMVPLRFVGEALGENVHWNAASNTVSIDAAGDYDLPQRHDHDHDHDHPPFGNPPPPPPNGRPGGPPPPQFVFQSGWVLPVTLNDNLDSDRNYEGDKFSVTVQDTPHIPHGTRIDGTVVGVRPRNGDDPGMLELKFYQMDLPNGRSFPIDGALIDLNDKSIEHRGDHIFAKPTEANNRAAITGIGAGAGLIIGLSTHKPIRDAAIGGLLGLAAGSFDHSHSNDVHLRRGATFGVHLNRDARFQP